VSFYLWPDLTGGGGGGGGGGTGANSQKTQLSMVFFRLRISPFYTISTVRTSEPFYLNVCMQSCPSECIFLNSLAFVHTRR
jgi:hypothetical protein